MAKTARTTTSAMKGVEAIMGGAEAMNVAKGAVITPSPATRLDTPTPTPNTPVGIPAITSVDQFRSDAPKRAGGYDGDPGEKGGPTGGEKGGNEKLIGGIGKFLQANLKAAQRAVKAHSGGKSTSKKSKPSEKNGDKDKYKNG